ncbi:MAG: proteasome assembly chaperone family protein [Thermoplasmata archaeon]
MDNVLIKILKKPKLKDPILIEGLPGVGNVGKIAADYFLLKSGGIKFAEIYSKYLPPQVLINEDGTIYLVKNELYYVKRKNRRDLIILVGDYQGMSNEGQFEISYEILKFLKNFGVREIITLGGYGTGQMPEKPRVFGASTNDHFVNTFKEYGVLFGSGEPSNGIVGAAGLLIGLGMNFFEMNGICLMGETPGFYSDPKGALALLEILSKFLNEKIDTKDLEEKVKALNDITQKLSEKIEDKSKNEDLGYIG